MSLAKSMIIMINMCYLIYVIRLESTIGKYRVKTNRLIFRITGSNPSSYVSLNKPLNYSVQWVSYM